MDLPALVVHLPYTCSDMSVVQYRIQSVEEGGGRIFTSVYIVQSCHNNHKMVKLVRREGYTRGRVTVPWKWENIYKACNISRCLQCNLKDLGRAISCDLGAVLAKILSAQSAPANRNHATYQDDFSAIWKVWEGPFNCDIEAILATF